MNAPYFIRRKALEDLDSIWQYTYFQWSRQQADKYYNLLIDKILFLAANVEAGRKIDHIKAERINIFICRKTFRRNVSLGRKKRFITPCIPYGMHPLI